MYQIHLQQRKYLVCCFNLNQPFITVEESPKVEYETRNGQVLNVTGVWTGSVTKSAQNPPNIFSPEFIFKSLLSAFLRDFFILRLCPLGAMVSPQVLLANFILIKICSRWCIQVYVKRRRSFLKLKLDIRKHVHQVSYVAGLLDLAVVLKISGAINSFLKHVVTFW